MWVKLLATLTVCTYLPITSVLRVGMKRVGKLAAWLVAFWFYWHHCQNIMSTDNNLWAGLEPRPKTWCVTDLTIEVCTACNCWRSCWTIPWIGTPFVQHHERDPAVSQPGARYLPVWPGWPRPCAALYMVGVGVKAWYIIDRGAGCQRPHRHPMWTWKRPRCQLHRSTWHLWSGRAVLPRS